MTRSRIIARPFCVVADRIPASVKGEVASRLGLSVASVAGTVAPLGAEALLLSDISGETLEQALRQPFTGYVELDGDNDTVDDGVLAALATQCFYLSLTTATAMGMRSAVLVCDALHERGVLSKARRPNIELCLHEAVANALVHGNLGVPSSVKAQPEGYKLFSQLIHDRLEDAAARRRRVEIFARWDDESLVLGVADQGGGFDLACLPAKNDENAPSGRGFLFMRELTTSVNVTDGGRCTSMCFPV
ncbi:MAG TPA: ATP-binding protein [Azospirillaceae bacterium]|nr:ATP-binding protein [Azospirillaceae bacterium]